MTKACAREAEGSQVEIKILDYSQETVERLVAMCKGLNKPVGEDDKSREKLIEALEGYLNGAQSKKDTLQMVEDGLKMYLAE